VCDTQFLLLTERAFVGADNRLSLSINFGRAAQFERPQLKRTKPNTLDFTNGNLSMRLSMAAMPPRQFGLQFGV
jgi:hypothetical protein